MTETIGRRERKKAQTRKALADAALRLFLERGFDQVGVKDVAEAADVSLTTLFKHFPSKEALVFDQESDIESALVTAVHDRPAGWSIPRALGEHILRSTASVETPEMASFIRLIQETPALREYARRMWMRHETALAHAIARETGAPEDDITCAALARFILDARDLIHRSPNPRQAADRIISLLESGHEGG
ncbi:TetR/AcrR family transcriptional regulator [Nonomuraea sediminis]|uniref:TetR/AcrR family transcriptional regulator n=1 Tax=Nonomuraea sediminis TaxID=2835864 RepID=UPI0027DF058C|nr:helix-turn-helix domain-containing protein [Nonomuraea sediminis]